MAARTLPNLGLKAFYTLGEDGWGDDMSLNLLKLSVLVQGGVSAKVAAEPGSPSEGDIVLLDESHSTYPNQIAIYDDSEWKYLGEPSVGWCVFNQDTGIFVVFGGSTWENMKPSPAPVVTIGGTSHDLAAEDESCFLEFTNASAKTLNVMLEANEALPINGEFHIYNAGAGNLTITPEGGVTVTPPTLGTLVIPQGAAVTLKRAAADVFRLIGQTVPA